jgi:hypothetical protein
MPNGERCKARTTGRTSRVGALTRARRPAACQRLDSKRPDFARPGLSDPRRS